MSRTRVTILAVLSIVIGGATLVYVLLFVSPYTPEHQLSMVGLLAFFGGFFLFASGLGTATAIFLHRRWPMLAGPRPARRVAQRPVADAALRQGILAGVALAALVALAMVRVLDITFAIVALLLAGLVEAYVQIRR